MAYVQNWPCQAPCTPAPVPKPEPKPEPKDTAAQTDAGTQTEVMVNNVPQILRQIIQTSQALPVGTLFPELNKPLTSTSAPITAQPTGKQLYSFAAWEMRLYLDTHPADAVALSVFQQMAASAGEPNYASSFVTPAADGRWTWLDGPWPWEYGASSAGTTRTAEV